MQWTPSLGPDPLLQQEHREEDTVNKRTIAEVGRRKRTNSFDRVRLSGTRHPAEEALIVVDHDYVIRVKARITSRTRSEA